MFKRLNNQGKVAADPPELGVVEINSPICLWKCGQTLYKQRGSAPSGFVQCLVRPHATIYLFIFVPFEESSFRMVHSFIPTASMQFQHRSLCAFSFILLAFAACHIISGTAETVLASAVPFGMCPRHRHEASTLAYALLLDSQRHALSSTLPAFKTLVQGTSLLKIFVTYN